MLLIVCNDPEVPAGNFNDTISKTELPCRTIHPYRGEDFPPLEDVSAAIVLGGSMGVHDSEKHPFLSGVREFILGTIRSQTPLLGICLGGQLLADVLGGRVISGSPFGEKGTHAVRLTEAGKTDPLFAGISAEFISFQWHNDSFDVPPGAVHLASSTTCPGQAFRYGHCVWGTQFHPEVDRGIVDSWARWSKETAERADTFVAEFVSHEQSYLGISRRLLGNFLCLAGLVSQPP